MLRSILKIPPDRVSDEACFAFPFLAIGRSGNYRYKSKIRQFRLELLHLIEQEQLIDLIGAEVVR